MTTARKLFGAQCEAKKTIAFDGTAGNGAVGTVDLFDLSGIVNLRGIFTVCEKVCVGASLIEMGVPGNAAGLMGQGNLAAPGDTVGAVWVGVGNRGIGIRLVPGPSGEGGTVLTLGPVQFTIAAADITDGILTVYAYYDPITEGATLK